MGPSSGDISNQNEENHAGANDQQVDDKLGKGGYSTAVEKEEISSVGISKFQNESEQRPDYDRLEQSPE